MMSAVKKELLWFGAGFALAAVLSVSYEAVRRFVPMAVAFGLLCFGCGVLLVVFLSLRRRQGESVKIFEDWMKEKSELEKEKEAFQKEKEDFEDEKAVWEATHSDEPNAEESR